MGEFKNGSQKFDAFLEPAVMEHYIGPLDGNNLERNLQMVMKLVSEGGVAK